MVLGIATIGALAGCSSSSTTASDGFGGGEDAGAARGGGDTASGETAGSGGAASGGGSSFGTPASDGDGGAAARAAGVLTAGMWDDNLNYDFFGGYLAAHPSLDGNPGFTKGDYDAAHAEFAQRSARRVVDAALVLDTTGSMGDEIAYLTAEFANIAGAVSAAYPGADQRWALVLYRDVPEFDTNDAYVVQSFDFTGDAQKFAATIGQQSAGGGGDTPESPELGLEEMQKLTWRTGSDVAKIAFWIGDAPHHAQSAPAMKKAISDAHAAGIHVYPVSASGTDALLELTMRSAAELTGGRYLFLTDDSGVGDSHKIPEIPCYFVTKLSKALVRSVAMELTGTDVPAAAADVIRSSGSPSADGTCTTSDGETVHVM